MTRAVWIAMAIFTGVMIALGIDRYVTYHAGADLGEFTQSIADWAHGMHNQGEGGSHFVNHFSPALYLGAPLLLALRSPIALTVIQAVAVALTAPAIYLLARRRVDELLASLAAIVALLYPPLVGVTFNDFHENGFAPAALAWLVWAVDARRFGLALLCAGLALAIKEDEALLLAALAAGYALWSMRRHDAAAARFAGVVSVVSAAVFVAYFAFVRPLAGASGPWFALGYYAQGAHDAAHGWAAVFGRISYLLEALVPLLFLPALSPWGLLAVPGLIEVLTSRWTGAYTMGNHYPGVWIAFVLAAFVDRLAAIARADRARALRLVKICMIVCSAILIFASPTHWGHYLGPRTAHHAALDRILERIPAAASVGSVDEVYAHLGLNPNAHVGYAGNLEYMVVDERYDSATFRNMYRAQLDAQLGSGAFQAVASEDGVTLYRLRQRR